MNPRRPPWQGVGGSETASLSKALRLARFLRRASRRRRRSSLFNQRRVDERALHGGAVYGTLSRCGSGAFPSSSSGSGVVAEEPRSSRCSTAAYPRVRPLRRRPLPGRWPGRAALEERHPGLFLEDRGPAGQGDFVFGRHKAWPGKDISKARSPSTPCRPSALDGARASAITIEGRVCDRKLILASLTEALTDGDAQAFKEILAAHLEVVQKESFYQEAGISRRTLYRMLAPSGNPTLENIARVVRAIAKSAA